MKIGDHKPIQVVKAPAWNFLGTDEECWYGKSTNNQGSGVIENNYMDYVEEELLPSPWSFQSNRLLDTTFIKLHFSLIVKIPYIIKLLSK